MCNSDRRFFADDACRILTITSRGGTLGEELPLARFRRAEHASDFCDTPRARSRNSRTYGRVPFVRSRANCATNEEVLRRRPEDAALKFRGCFQAVCEPRRVPIGRRGLVSPQGGMVCGRQGVVVLEPTYRASK